MADPCQIAPESMTMCCAVLSLTHAVVNGPLCVKAPSAESMRWAIVVQLLELRVVQERLVPEGLVYGALVPPQVGLGIPRLAELTDEITRMVFDERPAVGGILLPRGGRLHTWEEPVEELGVDPEHIGGVVIAQAE